MDTIDVYAHYANEGDYPDLDYLSAERHLSAALRCRTVWAGEKTDLSQFAALHSLIRDAYPNLMNHATFELVGQSVLLTLPGTDSSLEPAMLIAHQDVVPVVAGTEGQWERDPFSGMIDDEWIWGRGALDIKDMLVAELEAVEHLLARGERPRRGVILAFGEDAEVDSHGATALAALLAKRGVRAAFLLDEGTTTMADGAAWGAPGCVISDVCLSQKGYANVRLTARGQGGHSSNPFGGTSLERLCRAVARLCETKPAPQLTDVMRQTFKTLAPAITAEPLSSLCAEVDANAGAIASLCASRRELFPFVCTTVAPNVLEGSSTAANVMPADVSCTVNFRLLPGVTAEGVVRLAREAVGDPEVEVELLHTTPAGRQDSPEGMGYAELREAIGHFHPGVVVVPSMVCGGTDSVRYEGVCGSILRFCPARPAPCEEARGVHGVNERISRRTFRQSIRLLVRLLEKTVL